MNKTTYHVERMDCAAEEQMIRMHLGGLEGVQGLSFDLPMRRLDVYHTGDRAALTAKLKELRLGAIETEHTAGLPDAFASETTDPKASPREKRPLAIALAINAAFFAGELTAGLLAGSMGLVADSLDMLADAMVYALSLAAVGHSVHRKKRLARSSGYLQLGLAMLGLVEVFRRFAFGDEVPDFTVMMTVASVALVANVYVLRLLSRARTGEAHIEATWIFTSNDIKVNLLVIVSGGLVWATSSPYPDLLAGGLIFLIVANGARRILALSR